MKCLYIYEGFLHFYPLPQKRHAARSRRWYLRLERACVCVCSEINSWHLYILDTKVQLCLQLLSSKWHSDAPGPECPVADLWWLTAQTQRTKTAALCEVWPGDRQKSREQHSSTRLQLSSTSQRYEWTLTCGYTGYSFSSALSCNDIDCLVATTSGFLQFSTEPPTDTGYLRYR